MATTLRVRQMLRGVALELDALFEVDEVELDLLGAAGEREVGDDDVEEGRFARTGFAGKERVLARALADGEILEFRRAGAADGDAQFVGGVARSTFRPACGAICEKGTSTRLESMLLLPILWTSSTARSGSGGGSKHERRAELGLLLVERPIRVPSRRMQTLFLRSSSGTKPSGSGWRWSQ